VQTFPAVSAQFLPALPHHLSALAAQDIPFCQAFLRHLLPARFTDEAPEGLHRPVTDGTTPGIQQVQNHAAG
jgi:hypothetical protein